MGRSSRSVFGRVPMWCPTTTVLAKMVSRQDQPMASSLSRCALIYRLLGYSCACPGESTSLGVVPEGGRFASLPCCHSLFERYGRRYRRGWARCMDCRWLFLRSQFPSTNCGLVNCRGLPAQLTKTSRSSRRRSSWLRPDAAFEKTSTLLCWLPKYLESKYGASGKCSSQRDKP